MKEIVLLGVGATLILDVWGLIRKPLLGIPAPDYRFVGRWIGHMGQGRYRHDAIGKAEPIRQELLIGWTVHYLTGIAFAGVLIAAVGPEWVEAPTVGPALVVGFGTTVLPFFVMQPAFGAGFAAARAPHPTLARVQTIVTHGVFGLGLYATAWMV